MATWVTPRQGTQLRSVCIRRLCARSNLRLMRTWEVKFLGKPKERTLASNSEQEVSPEWAPVRTGHGKRSRDEKRGNVRADHVAGNEKGLSEPSMTKRRVTEETTRAGRGPGGHCQEDEWSPKSISETLRPHAPRPGGAACVGRLALSSSALLPGPKDMLCSLAVSRGPRWSPTRRDAVLQNRGVFCAAPAWRPAGAGLRTQPDRPGEGAV